MLNSCTFIGRAGQDPEIRATKSGDTVANLSIACESGYGDKKQTEWVRLVFFGKVADIVQQYVGKGTLLYVNGRMQTRKWQDRDGNDKYSTEVVVNDMRMLSKGEARSEAKEAQPMSAGDFDDLEAPF